MPEGTAKDGLKGLLFHNLIFSMAKVLGEGGGTMARHLDFTFSQSFILIV